jgi:hypothetical protein
MGRMPFFPEGQPDSSQARSAWTCSLDTSRELGCRHRRVFGPTGHESLAQGLPWETHPNVRSPEGATGISGYVPRPLVSRRPFRAPGKKLKTQGKPWAKFFSPFGAGLFGPGESLNT